MKTKTKNDDNNKVTDVDTTKVETEATTTKKKKKKPTKTKIGPTAAMRSIFFRHFTRTPVLSVSGSFFAVAQAILSTYQGAVINELTKAVTAAVKNNSSESGRLETTSENVERLSFTLIVVWFAANVARFIF